MALSGTRFCRTRFEHTVFADVKLGEAVLEDAPGNLVWGSDRPIALLGVEGLAVIDAGDALLIARLDRSGDVRKIVARLRQDGGTRLL